MRLEHLLSGAIGFYPVGTKVCLEEKFHSIYIVSCTVYLFGMARIVKLRKVFIIFARLNYSCGSTRFGKSSGTRLEHSPIAQLVRALH